MAILGVVLFFILAGLTPADGLPQVEPLRRTFQSRKPLSASHLGRLLAPSPVGVQISSLALPPYTSNPSFFKISTDSELLMSNQVPEKYSEVIPLKTYLEKKGVKVLFWKPDRTFDAVVRKPQKKIRKALPKPTTEQSKDLIIMEFSAVTETEVPQVKKTTTESTTTTTTEGNTKRKTTTEKFSDEVWNSDEITTENDAYDETTTDDWIEETTIDEECDSFEETTHDGKFSGEEADYSASLEDDSGEYTTNQTKD